MFARFMCVFDFVVIVFRITWWQSAGKALEFPFVLFLFYAVCIIYVPFPLGVWGGMWNSIVSVPDIAFSSTFQLFEGIFC